jgi:uncharacterized damage-inducible protein DinB
MERHDPDLQGDERTVLEQWMDFQRATLLWKCEGLTDEQLATQSTASSLTLAGLLKHLALVEDHWFRQTLLGLPPSPPWADVDWDATPDWEFETARSDPGAELIAGYQRACAASREAAASMPSLDSLSARVSRRRGAPYSLRWIYLHMIEETARHNGHADLIREAIDGATGE